MSLYVHQSGCPAATAIVFLHGAGVSSWMWGEQIAALQQDYHCIAIDLPGNGESYQQEWVSFADTAVQVAAIIRQTAAGGKAHVVGLSLGGYTGLHLLQRHSEVVESLVVSGVSAKPFENVGRWRLYLKLMSRVMKWDIFINLQAKMLQIPADAAELYKRDNKRMPTIAFNRIYEEVLGFTLPHFSSQLETRLLALAGDSENAMIKDSLTDFVKQRPQTVAAFVPNSHHAWNAEHPQLFTDMVAAWVASKPLPVELRLIGQN